MGKKDVNGQIPEAEAEAAEQEAPTEQAAAPEAPEATEAAPEDLAVQLAQELQQTKDQLLRQAAEYQNYRRRTDKERADWIRRGQIPVIEAMLGVLDDFRRSLDASQQVEAQDAPGPAYTALKEGVELVYSNFADALKKLGVETIEAEGKPFDENLHEALMQQPAPEGTAPGVVLQEIQRGYRLGDRVLRHTKVIVAA